MEGRNHCTGERRILGSSLFYLPYYDRISNGKASDLHWAQAKDSGGLRRVRYVRCNDASLRCLHCLVS